MFDDRSSCGCKKCHHRKKCRCHQPLAMVECNCGNCISVQRPKFRTTDSFCHCRKSYDCWQVDD